MIKPRLKMLIFVFSMILFAGFVHALVINEIMYDPAGTDSGHEWVELFNEQTSVDMTGFRFYEGGSAHSLTLIQGSGTLPAGSYAIITDDADQFLLDFPSFSGTLFDSTWSSLSNTGELLEMRDASDLVMDSVFYNSSWGGASNYTLELIDASLDNNASTSWLESTENGGTPGYLNSVSSQAPEFSLLTALFTFTCCILVFFAVRRRY
ncbi:lamin tail domain-containing protein [Candidatus Woesearchaeota archaeon]|nr:lamin tail domain-containing protein [Candidatus Woesearchaeota archaeon]